MRVHRAVHVLALAWLGVSLAGAGGWARAGDSGDAAALEAAIRDLQATFGSRYPAGAACLERLRALAPADQAGLARLRRAALLANPLLDFDRLLLVRRGTAGPLGLPANWDGNSSLPRSGFKNAIVQLSPLDTNGALTVVFQPPQPVFVGDVDLHADGTRFLFSSVATNGRWRVFEGRVDGAAPPVVVPQIAEPDVDNYDACYLPDESLIFASTAPFIGVPCVRGSSHVANLYRWSRDSGAIRRLTFDQDHNWCPTVMPDGRVMYLRWEYADIPHYVSRILFTMNPDGTNQRELYGSNSYWPNSLFFARPMPGHPSKFVGIVSGHHDVPRMGELVVFDPARGRREAEGAVQRIPGRGRRVEAVIRDGLVGGSWPKFLHPWPLSENYVLAACKPDAAAPWGIYLADVFDNLVLVKECPDAALLEPLPLRPQARAPVIPSRVAEGTAAARMQIADIYAGPGLAGVPRGTVKRLRLVTYHFSYHGMGGQIDRIGMDGPWDIKRVLGTVPVAPDGSAYFEVPANTPISLQPLDAQNRALALMRSWTTAMPGEVQTCVGCHESQSSGAGGMAANPRAVRGEPARIEPWYGPARGFAFEREVQPVLDRYCVGCHNGAAAERPDFSRRPAVHMAAKSAAYIETPFPPAYLALRRYVRGHTIESDMHLLPPYEFHAGTSELCQRLERGHHGVRLDAEAWDRLHTWIDVNTPVYGTWTELCGAGRVTHQAGRRRHCLDLYAPGAPDPEAVPPVAPAPAWVAPAPADVAADEAAAGPGAAVSCPGWPFAGGEAVRLQQAAAAGGAVTRQLALGDGVTLELFRIPAGSYVAGGGTTPRRRVEVPRAFWMARDEVSNALFARCDPRHDSRLEHGDFLQFSERERGYPLNAPEQPACRVSWEAAQAFCAWVSSCAGVACALPSGAQWEWACRAGADTPLAYGDAAADFSKLANLADAALLDVETLGWGLPSGAVPPWRPAAGQVNDGFRVSAPVGRFAPNAWGLRDMQGNVWEWTRDADRDGVRRLARGGSWYDRPARALADSAVAYAPWQKVYNVGFRIVVED